MKFLLKLLLSKWIITIYIVYKNTFNNFYLHGALNIIFSFENLSSSICWLYQHWTYRERGAWWWRAADVRPRWLRSRCSPRWWPGPRVGWCSTCPSRTRGPPEPCPPTSATPSWAPELRWRYIGDWHFLLHQRGDDFSCKNDSKITLSSCDGAGRWYRTYSWWD